MKIAFRWFLFTSFGSFLCGAAFSARHLLMGPESSATQAEAQAFDRWQEATGTDGEVKPEIREKLLPLMARSDGPRAWKMLTQGATKPRMADMQQIAREWAKKDGHAAVAFGQRIQDAVERNTFLTVAYSCWFGQEPQAFLTWLRSQPDSEPVVAFMNYADYRELLTPEVASLDHLVALYEDRPTTPKPLTNLMMRVWELGNQKEAVMAWLRRQPESEDRDRSWREIANDLAGTDAQAAAALATEVTSPEIRRALCSGVAAWMAKADIDAALKYAQSQPDEIGRDKAWKSVIGTWLMRDPAAVLDHLKAHQDSITTDKLDRSMGTLMAWLPEDSLAVLQKMQGPEEQRDAVVDGLMYEWRDRSREAMLRWLDTPAAEWLTPEKLQRYRQMAQAPPSLGGSGSRTIQGRRVWR